MDGTESSATCATEALEAKLARLEERYRYELLGEEERCELWYRIAKLRRKTGFGVSALRG